MNIPKLITPEETAAVLNVTTSTLAVWRCTNRYDLPLNVGDSACTKNRILLSL